jgi:hypothetical protein
MQIIASRKPPASRDRDDRSSAPTVGGIGRRGPWLAVIGVLVVGLMIFPSALAKASYHPASETSLAYNHNETALFPTDQYGDAKVPQYLNMVWASVQEKQGSLYFRVHVNATIPDHPSPSFSPNHLGVTFGILTNLSASGSPWQFIGHKEQYHLNYLVGMIYTAKGDGLHIGLGWRAFITTDGLNFTRVPSSIDGSTYLFQVNAAALGHPESFRWLVAAECDPVANQFETYQTTLLVDYVPNFGYASWSNEADG